MDPSRINRRDFLKISALVGGAEMLAPTVTKASPRSPSLRPTQAIDKEVDSCCQFCQVRCTTKVQIKNDRVVNVYGNPDNYWTKGSMCPKGKALAELTYSPHRLVYPLLRDGSGWKRIAYDQAVSMVAERILKVKNDHPDDYAHRVCLFAPLWESRESELAALMALHLAGFPDICSPGDVCIGSSATALRICLGSANSTTTLDEILNTETLVLFGANLAEVYPPYMRWIEKAKQKGVNIIYVDPRVTPTSSFCDKQLKPRPGTDGALILGVIRILIKEQMIDRTHVDAHLNGFDELEKAAEGYTADKVADITWIPEDKVVQFACTLGRSKRTLVWMGGSISRNTNAINTARAVIALQAITNNLSGSGKGIMNVQGGKPGGEEKFIEHYAAPGIPVRRSFRKILYSMERDGVDVLLLNSTYRRYPDATRVKDAIGKVGFVVYRGFFMDEEAELADLIIPGTMVFESEGSQYGGQRQVVWRNQAIEKPGETVEDWRFYTDLGKKLCKDTFPNVTCAQEIYELCRSASPSWKGLTIERLKQSPTGVTWPCASTDEPERKGTLYPDSRFHTPDGKVELRSRALGPIKWKEPMGSPKGEKSKHKDFPLIFTQGKVVQHWQHTYTNWSAYMGQFSDGNYVQVNPETAKELGLEDEDAAYIETSLGKLKVHVRLTESILPGVVFTPSHPGPANPMTGNKGGTINTIIPGYWDKVSAQFNGFGCRLEKA